MRLRSVLVKIKGIYRLFHDCFLESREVRILFFFVTLGLHKYREYIVGGISLFLFASKLQGRMQSALMRIALALLVFALILQRYSKIINF